MQIVIRLLSDGFIHEQIDYRCLLRLNEDLFQFNDKIIAPNEMYSSTYIVLRVVFFHPIANGFCLFIKTNVKH